MTLVIKPRSGARASRVTPIEPDQRRRQPVTNREWQEARRRARHQAIFSRTFEGLFAKLLGRVKG